MAIPQLTKEALSLGSKLGKGLGGSFDIFEINVETQSTTVIKALKKAGLKNAAADIEFKLSKEASKAMNFLSNSALKAAKSTVPIKSGTLRNENIVLSQPAFRSGGTGATITRTVSIEGEHMPPYRNSEVDSVKLALVLNTEDFARSQGSHAIGGYDSIGGSTSGWIEEAQSQFRQKKGKLLLSRFS